jgi:hypothetical protein
LAILGEHSTNEDYGEGNEIKLKRRTSMKRNIVWTMFFIAMLLISLAAVAKEKDECTCSPAMVAGTWGYSETGTMILPAPYGALPYASVGSYTVDPDGNLSGARTASLGGTKLEATITGTATVDTDCTGTITLLFTDKTTGQQNTAEKFIVYVDNAREARMIITSAPFPSVLTTEAKKLFPNSDNPGRHLGNCGQ